MSEDERPLWTREDHEQAKRELRNLPEPKKTRIKGIIQDATYHKDQGFIAVQLGLPDGTRRAAYIHKSAYSFHGNPWTEVPSEYVDKEMEKTAELFRRARGRRIKLEIGEDQARMD
jgi:hypothetical protein